MNMHPTGKITRDERLSAIMGDDGITNCGNAQNCVRACPMSLPLTKAIYEENRETVLHGLFGWVRKEGGNGRRKGEGRGVQLRPSLFLLARKPAAPAF